MAVLSKLKSLASDDFPDPWEPPTEGTVKILCAATIPKTSSGVGRFAAVARDSSGDLVGVSYGEQLCDAPPKLQPLMIQMKAVGAALGSLAKKMDERGAHAGSFVLATCHKFAAGLSQVIETAMGVDARNSKVVLEDEDWYGANAVLLGDDDLFVGDLDEEGEWCATLVGDELPGPLPWDFLDAIEQDKLLAGLTPSKEASQAHATDGNAWRAGVGGS